MHVLVRWLAIGPIVQRPPMAAEKPTRDRMGWSTQIPLTQSWDADTNVRCMRLQGLVFIACLGDIRSRLRVEGTRAYLCTRLRRSPGIPCWVPKRPRAWLKMLCVGRYEPSERSCPSPYTSLLFLLRGRSKLVEDRDLRKQCRHSDRVLHCDRE